MLESYGPGYRFYSFGTDHQLDLFEAFLEQLDSESGKIQAVWCECPSNPLLRTANLDRIRALANRYDFPVVVDDTIGSWANVDVFDVADIVITSLTKSFNGYADVLAGSMILNPNSSYYTIFQKAFHASYTNNLFLDDAIRLEQNSRDFLRRAAILNETAEFLVENIRPLVLDAESVVSAVYYPKLCWSKNNYDRRMRPATDDFVPGYGYLFSIEFKSVSSAAAFLDNLDVYKGPSIGANITLALPYVQMVLQKEKQWASTHGLAETIVRISVGLEDKGGLLQKIMIAMQAAEQIM
ncbi:hypothetical protein CNMCM8927_000883 [Aspergillus lentulus]|uniref:Cystathionine gamma-synthase n=1 Tax=Aspergillus lentulus TaxID=293939 RepID=A0AAN5YIL8_ASPLE|nr:hypothetical protein CNMCM8927_000883 [Aspergillus lentulus]